MIIWNESKVRIIQRVKSHIRFEINPTPLSLNPNNRQTRWNRIRIRSSYRNSRNITTIIAAGEADLATETRGGPGSGKGTAGDRSERETTLGTHFLSGGRGRGILGAATETTQCVQAVVRWPKEWQVEHISGTQPYRTRTTATCPTASWTGIAEGRLIWGDLNQSLSIHQFLTRNSICIKTFQITNVTS